MFTKWFRFLPVMLCAWLALSAVPTIGHAASAGPLFIVVPAPAGGTADVVIRTLAPKLGQILNQTIIVENRPGAGTGVASAFVARANPTGNTLLMAYTSHATNTWLLDNLSA